MLALVCAQQGTVTWEKINSTEQQNSLILRHVQAYGTIQVLKVNCMYLYSRFLRSCWCHDNCLRIWFMYLILWFNFHGLTMYSGKENFHDVATSTQSHKFKQKSIWRTTSCILCKLLHIYCAVGITITVCGITTEWFCIVLLHELETLVFCIRTQKLVTDYIYNNLDLMRHLSLLHSLHVWH